MKRSLDTIPEDTESGPAAGVFPLPSGQSEVFVNWGTLQAVPGHKFYGNWSFTHGDVCDPSKQSVTGYVLRSQMRNYEFLEDCASLPPRARQLRDEVHGRELGYMCGAARVS